MAAMSASRGMPISLPYAVASLITVWMPSL
jgi:hypothetical protein